ISLRTSIIMKKRTLIFLMFLAPALLLNQGKIHANPSQIVYLRPSETVIQEGKASWYSEQSPGINKHTANNEVFDDSGLTAAMWEVPFNQMVKVTNLENGKSVIVRVNDRGPHKRFVSSGRIIDLSKQAFSAIASLDKGLIRIELELL
ncbi:MAG: septal ring lytic transglycosylase RlpA family protein, partial [Candidatus Omnitrophica bacterium]|nr:septal ring lytic transglycosylase RlpA family protein [Candidatus Omnitrophota bacterium]